MSAAFLGVLEPRPCSHCPCPQHTPKDRYLGVLCYAGGSLANWISSPPFSPLININLIFQRRKRLRQILLSIFYQNKCLKAMTSCITCKYVARFLSCCELLTDTVCQRHAMMALVVRLDKRTHPGPGDGAQWQRLTSCMQEGSPSLSEMYFRALDMAQLSECLPSMFLGSNPN